ncbi:MAG TPA: iron dependent repressor, metal binding and dimerization domain protein, partial [Patescibacteria group bacterium]|nr:iron dependent repressor, metal binding and dimerization domain protein [Patescibacteria group bacterium]
MTEHAQDEILELLWTLREERKANRAEVLRSAAEPGPERLLEELVEGGMVDASGEEIHLTKSGEDRARGIIRRHRLAEVLLQNLFDLGDSQLEDSACQFEHILSEPVVESVCTFLGHPPACPHGRPIPRGECCDRIRTEIRPLVMRLTEASLGAAVRIVFITPRSKKRLEKLSALGIV